MSISVQSVAKAYGDTVALSGVTFEVGPGVTGLLGHNGAGKSTLLKLLAGFAAPDEGQVRVLGADPRGELAIQSRLGIVPDGDGLWPHLTAREAVRACARLRGVADADGAARRALAEVGLADDMDRRLRGYSKGMRQRAKLAQALAHDPDVLLLDEPLNGLDPAQRRHVIDVVQRLGAAGRTVLVSSHVLHEVERLAPRVVVLVNGRLVAEGETAGIRALLRDRPRTVHVETRGDVRPLAARLAAEPTVESLALADGAVTVDIADPERFGVVLAAAARDAGATLVRVEPVGDDLESLYAYLTARARGAAR